jgi:hypothetical protein
LTATFTPEALLDAIAAHHLRGLSFIKGTGSEELPPPAVFDGGG